jgi:competence protein ComEA
LRPGDRAATIQKRMFSHAEQHRWVAAAVAVLAGLLAAAAFLFHAGGGGRGAVPVAAPAEPLEAAVPAAALVHVSGAVAHPGLYRLSPSARVADAVAAAGGITADADPGRLPDLAARVHDGRQVNVPFRRAGGAGAGSRAVRVDLNSATVDELRALPGMPDGLAEAIVEARDLWGPFGSVSDLRTLLGADPATVAALRPLVVVRR